MYRALAYPLGVTALAALAYWFGVQCNELLFAWSGHSEGVDWVFLPSGLRLMLVLVAPVPGAVGIAMATLFEAVSSHPGDAWGEAVVTAAISGGSPWIARWMCIRLGATDNALARLSGGGLLAMSAVFALVSSSLHQSWYAFREAYASPLDAWPAMLVGDLVGSLLVLYLVRFWLRARA